MRIDLTFTHDDRDRLTEVRWQGGTARYRYDDAGNLLAVEGVGAAAPAESPPPVDPGGPRVAGLACGACGRPVTRDDLFCRHCGARLQ